MLSAKDRSLKTLFNMKLSWIPVLVQEIWVDASPCSLIAFYIVFLISACENGA